MGFDIDQELGQLHSGTTSFVGDDVAAQTVRTTKPRKSSDQDSVAAYLLADTVTDYNTWLKDTMRSAAVRFSDNTAGTTVAAFVVDPDSGKVHFSSAGDSSIYGVFRDKKGKIVVRQINQLHEATSRQKAGGLEMCSTFGDKASNVSSRANEVGFEDTSWEKLKGRHSSIQQRYLSNDNSTFDMAAYAQQQGLEPLGVMAASDGFDPKELEKQLKSAKTRGAITKENFAARIGEMMPKVITQNRLAALDDCGWVAQAMPNKGDRAKVCVVADGHDNAGGGSLSNAVVHYIGECAKHPLAHGGLSKADLVALLEAGTADNQLCVLDGLLYKGVTTSTQFTEFVAQSLTGEDRAKSPYEQAAIVQAALEANGTPQLKAEIRLATLSTGLSSLQNIKKVWNARGIEITEDAFHNNLFNTVAVLQKATERAREAFVTSGDVDALQASIARIEKIKQFIDLYMLVRQDPEVEFLGVTQEERDTIKLNAMQITEAVTQPYYNRALDLNTMQTAAFDQHFATVLNEDVLQFVKAINKETPFASLEMFGVAPNFLEKLEAYMKDVNGVPLPTFQKLRSVMTAIEYDPSQDRLTLQQLGKINNKKQELEADFLRLKGELDGYFGVVQETAPELAHDGDLHAAFRATVDAWSKKSDAQKSRDPELLAKLGHVERAGQQLDQINLNFIGVNSLSAESKKNIMQYFKGAIQPYEASRFGHASEKISKLSAEEFGEKLDKNVSKFVSYTFEQVVTETQNKIENNQELLGEDQTFHAIRTLGIQEGVKALSLVQREFTSLVHKHPLRAVEMFNKYAPRIADISSMRYEDLAPAIAEIRYNLKAEKITARMNEIICPIPDGKSNEVNDFHEKITSFIDRVIHGGTKGESGRALDLSEDIKVIDSVFAYMDDALGAAAEKTEYTEKLNVCLDVISVASSLMDASGTVSDLQKAFRKHVTGGAVNVDALKTLPPQLVGKFSPEAMGMGLKGVGKG